MKMKRSIAANTASAIALCVGVVMPAVADTGKSDVWNFLPVSRPDNLVPVVPDFSNVLRDPIRINLDGLSFSLPTDSSDEVAQVESVRVTTEIEQKPSQKDIDEAMKLAMETVVELPVLEIHVSHNAEPDESEVSTDIFAPKVEVADAAPDTPIVVEAPDSLTQVAIVTSDISPSDFLLARKRYIDSLVHQDPGQDEAVEYVRFMVGSMMLDEARSFITGMERNKEREPALAAYYRAAELLSGTAELLSVRTFEWPENSIWRYLEDNVSAGEPLEAFEIGKILSVLDNQSAAIADHMIPVLFDAAVVRKDSRIARTILSSAFERTELSGSARFILMQGQLASLEGADQRAFELFAAAAKLGGEEGAKAKLELAEFALDRNEQKYLPQAKKLLIEASHEWHGDAISLRLMTKLAEVAEEVSDLSVSLEVMGKIYNDFPDTPEARLAGIRIPVLLRSLRVSMVEDDFPVDEAISEVRRLGTRMEGHDGWVEMRHVLARKLQSAGLWEASLAEYGQLRSDLKKSKTTDDEFKKLVDVEVAELLRATGKIDRLEKHLSGMAEMTSDDLAERILIVGLMSDHAETMADVEGILSEHSDAPAVMLALARATTRAGMQDEAIRAYEAYAASGEHLKRDDAAHYIRATSSLGMRDMIGVSRISEGHDDLVAMGKGISTPAPILFPLSETSAYMMLDRADRVLNTAEALNDRSE